MRSNDNTEAMMVLKYGMLLWDLRYFCNKIYFSVKILPGASKTSIGVWFNITYELYQLWLLCRLYSIKKRLT